MVLYRSMARAKAAQAMQGPSRGSVHNSCGILTLLSVRTFFDWDGGGGAAPIIWAVKKQVVYTSTQKVGGSGGMLSPGNFFNELLGDRLFINSKWVQSYL